MIALCDDTWIWLLSNATSAMLLTNSIFHAKPEQLPRKDSSEYAPLAASGAEIAERLIRVSTSCLCSIYSKYSIPIISHGPGIDACCKTPLQPSSASRTKQVNLCPKLFQFSLRFRDCSFASAIWWSQRLESFMMNWLEQMRSTFCHWCYPFWIYSCQLPRINNHT